MGSKAKRMRGVKGRDRADNEAGAKMRNRDEELIESPLVQKSSYSDISPTFCVAMLKNGSTVKLEGKVEEFLQTLKEADFVWINVQVSDLKEDGVKIASMLGFNTSIVHELVSQRFSGYDDHTAELGLLLPAVRVTELEVEINKLIILMKSNMVVDNQGRANNETGCRQQCD